jgi:cytoskeletal protein CcmA (bactofilin family)
MLFRRKIAPSAPAPPAPADGVDRGPASGPGAEGEALRDPLFRRLPGGGLTLIGGQTRVKGELRGDGSIVVHGVLEGSVAIAGGLTVAPGGRVQADVAAHTVALEGEARGSIRAGDRVTLSESGVFEGRLATPILHLRPGSVLRGAARIAGVPVRDRRGLSH